MIRVTIYYHGGVTSQFDDEAGMATAWAQYAQLQGFGITMETI